MISQYQEFPVSMTMKNEHPFKPSGSGPRVGVIGGGLGGLTAACILAARGYSVSLFEANAWIGGKAAEHSCDGFRFDMGPTILTVPSVLRRVFAEAGHRLEDELELVPLDPQWRCFYPDGSTLDLVAEEDAMVRRLEAFAPGRGVGNGYRRFMQMSERQRVLSEDYFFWKSVGGYRDVFDLQTSWRLSTLRDLLAMRPGQTVAGAIRRCVRDARVAQMLDHFTQYVGSCPESSPAVLCGIAHMQTHEGVWYPRGGTRAVPVALARLARRLGVQIYTRAAVRRVETQAERIVGVVLNHGRRVDLDAVVCNSDVVRTHHELLAEDSVPLPARARQAEPACSGVVLYLGLNRRYDHLEHHNFIFSNDPHEEFEWIYRRGEPAPDPTCYVCAPARTEPGVAPPGGEALYVLVHTPYLRSHHDWSVMLPRYRDRIIKRLEIHGGMPDLRRRIVTECHLTPRDIHDRYRVHRGAIYGLASHGRLAGAFKSGNHSSAIRGLYYAGGSVHPGPGMPMAVMSGWIAADALDHDHLRSGPAKPAFGARSHNSVGTAETAELETTRA